MIFLPEFRRPAGNIFLYRSNFMAVFITRSPICPVAQLLLITRPIRFGYLFIIKLADGRVGKVHGFFYPDYEGTPTPDYVILIWLVK